MGISTDVPRYPVVDRAPSFMRTVTNFGFSDLGSWAAFAAASVPVGYFAAATPRLRGPSVVTATACGALAGFLFAFQSSAGRLMGERQ